MSTDAELLQRYVGSGAEDAFAELVRRHLGLVYHAALRQCAGNPQHAEEITQAVFTDLARKARTLSGRGTLTGWLHTSTRYAALRFARAERRRIAREQEAYMMTTHSAGDSAHDEAWSQLRPVIDETLHTLGERDREAVLLRFFAGFSLAEVGKRLAISEDGARMRVDRALEKLQSRLAAKGVTSTGTALTVVLSNQAFAAAPTGMAPLVCGAALANGTASGGAAALVFMGLNKIQVSVLSAVLVAGTAGFLVQEQTRTELTQELNQLRTEGVEKATYSANAPANATPAAASARESYELARLKAEAASLQAAASSPASRPTTKTGSRRTGAIAGEVYEPGQIDAEPQPLMRVPPKYPRQLQQTGKSGMAIISFVVDASGAVRDLRAEQATEPEFADAAMDALEQWQFTAGQKAGLPVNVRVQQQIRFTPGDKKTQTPEPWF